MPKAQVKHSNCDGAPCLLSGESEAKNWMYWVEPADAAADAQQPGEGARGAAARVAARRSAAARAAGARAETARTACAAPRAAWGACAPCTARLLCAVLCCLAGVAVPADVMRRPLGRPLRAVFACIQRWYVYAQYIDSMA